MTNLIPYPKFIEDGWRLLKSFHIYCWNMLQRETIKALQKINAGRFINFFFQCSCIEFFM
jgi:hypothetical protein